MVGVVSDSYNCLGGAENDTLSGDLPYGNIILSDICPNMGYDEGRATMQFALYIDEKLILQHR
jgi:large repetitive protein